MIFLGNLLKETVISQVFDWVIGLTGQQDSQSVTHAFIDILNEIPMVKQVDAFEVYGHKQVKADRSNNVIAQLARRFPLDFIGKNEEENLEWIGVFDSVSEPEITPVDKDIFLCSNFQLHTGSMDCPKS